MKRLASTLLVAALLPLSSFAATYTFTTTNSTITGLSHGTAATWGLGDSSISGEVTKYTSLFNDINASGRKVTQAYLVLTNIYDWQNEANDPADALFVNILSGLDTGVKSKVFDSAAAGRTQDLTFPTQGSPFFDNSSTSGDWNDILQASTALKFNDASANTLLKASSTDTKSGTPAAVSWSDPSGGAARGFNLILNFSAANLTALTTLIDNDASVGTPTVGLGFAAECHYYMTSATWVITVPDSGSTIALMGVGLIALAGFRRFKK